MTEAGILIGPIFLVDFPPAARLTASNIWVKYDLITWKYKQHHVTENKVGQLSKLHHPRKLLKEGFNLDEDTTFLAFYDFLT